MLVIGHGREGMLYLGETALPEGQRIIHSCPAVLGWGGMGKTREGDGRTPTGIFRVRDAYGICKNPGCHIPYTHITPDIYWCGESGSPDYNRPVRHSRMQPDSYGERLVEYVPEYHYLLDIGYNETCRPGRGSGIFLHCRGEKDYTRGCIAVEEAEMVCILRWLRPGALMWIQKIG